MDIVGFYFFYFLIYFVSYFLVIGGSFFFCLFLVFNFLFFFIFSQTFIISFFPYFIFHGYRKLLSYFLVYSFNPVIVTRVSLFYYFFIIFTSDFFFNINHFPDSLFPFSSISFHEYCFILLFIYLLIYPLFFLFESSLTRFKRKIFSSGLLKIFQGVNIFFKVTDVVLNVYGILVLAGHMPDKLVSKRGWWLS